MEEADRFFLFQEFKWSDDELSSALKNYRDQDPRLKGLTEEKAQSLVSEARGSIGQLVKLLDQYVEETAESPMKE